MPAGKGVQASSLSVPTAIEMPIHHILPYPSSFSRNSFPFVGIDFVLTLIARSGQVEGGLL